MVSLECRNRDALTARRTVLEYARSPGTVAVHPVDRGLDPTETRFISEPMMDMESIHMSMLGSIACWALKKDKSI